MCIAILNTSVELSRESLQNCWESNSHGAGLLYTDGTGLIREIELDDFGVFYTRYVIARASTPHPILLHFRIATSGAKNDTNCHPFLVPGTGWGFIHNGMLDVDSNHEHSDTWHFANCYLPQFKEVSLPWAQRIIEDLCGSYNKLVFLHEDGRTFLINDKAGHWDKAGDTWYSNESYLSNQYSFYGNQRVSRWGDPRDFAWDDDERTHRGQNPADKSIYADVHPDLNDGQLEEDYQVCTVGAEKGNDRLPFADPATEIQYQRWAMLRDVMGLDEIRALREHYYNFTHFPHYLGDDFTAKAEAWMAKNSHLLDAQTVAGDTLSDRQKKSSDAAPATNGGCRCPECGAHDSALLYDDSAEDHYCLACEEYVGVLWHEIIAKSAADELATC